MNFLTRKKKVISLLAIFTILVNTCVCAQMTESIDRSTQNKTAETTHVHASMHGTDMAGMDHASGGHNCCDEVTAIDCCHTPDYLPASNESFSHDLDFVAVLSSWPYPIPSKPPTKVQAFNHRSLLLSNYPPTYLVNCTFLN